MAITYAGNTITVDTTTYDFNDILVADIAGGWGVVSKQGNQYLIDASINIISSGGIVDDGVYVQIGTPGNLVTFAQSNGCIFQLGTPGSMGGGALVLWQSTSSYSNFYGVFKLYGVAFELKEGGYRWRVYSEMTWENVISKHIIGTPWFRNQFDSTAKRCSFNASSMGLFVYTGKIAFEDVTLDAESTRGFIANTGSQDIIVRNLVIADTVPEHFKFFTVTTIIRAYDSTFDIYKIATAHNLDSELHDYKNFRLRVKMESGIAISGATVTITDAFGTDIIETTDINGDITAQELKSFWVINNGNGTGVGVLKNTYTFHTPYTITIEKAGYHIEEYILDLLRDDHKAGINHSLSLIPLSDFLAIPVEVSVGNPNIDVTMEKAEVTVEIASSSVDVIIEKADIEVTVEKPDIDVEVG